MFEKFKETENKIDTNLQSEPTKADYKKYVRTMIIFFLVFGLLNVFGIIANTTWFWKYSNFDDKIFMLCSFFSYFIYLFIMCIIFNRRDYLKYSMNFIKYYFFINVIIIALFIFIASGFHGSIFDSNSSLFYGASVILPIMEAFGYLSRYGCYFIFMFPIISILFMFLSRKCHFKTKKYSVFVFVFLLLFTTLLPDLLRLSYYTYLQALLWAVRSAVG